LTNLGHGANDANGVYLYGELDATGPYFSDYQNLAPASISALLAAMKAKLVTLKTSAAQTLTTAITAGLTTWDGIAIHNALPGTWNAVAGTFTATVAGLYKVHAQVEFAGNNTGARTAIIQKALQASPTTFTAQSRNGYLGAVPSYTAVVPVTDFVQMAIGDVVRVAALQTSGGNLNVTNAQLDIVLA
jgi:hypothetical protein